MKTLGKILIIMLILSFYPISCNVSNAGEIEIGFTVTGDDGNTGIASRILVYYSTNQFDSTNYTIADTASFCGPPDSAGTYMTCTLTGLKDNALYYIGVRIADEVPNWSPMSNITSAIALDKIAPAQIVTLAVL